MVRHAFISHSNKDAEAADAIVGALEGRGVKCWTAPRDVTPGGSYAQSILNAIENSSCFVLVYTQHSNVSPHVLREVERALTMGINIIPIRFDDSSVCKSLDYLLATVHWLSVIAQPRETAIRSAAERIASSVSQADAALRAPPLPVPSFSKPVGDTSEKIPLAFWISLALGGLAVLALTFFAMRHLLAPKDESAAAPVALATPAPPQPPVAPPIPSVTAAPAPVSEIAEESAVASSESIGAPPPAQNFARETPVAIVRRYYEDLGGRDTIKAYELLSMNYRLHENFVAYTRNFASTNALRLLDARETFVGANAATVSVSFEKTNQRFGVIQWRGPVQLVREAAGWRIDNLRALRPEPRRR